MRGVLLSLLAVGVISTADVSGADYSPLVLATDVKVEHFDATVSDRERSREIPVRIYVSVEKPGDSPPLSPLLLFSHGLGGNRAGSAFLGEHWAARGYVAVFLQHPGSDDSVWKDIRLGERMKAMQQAASLQNFQLRVEDVSRVIDQVTQWTQQADHRLSGRVDVARIGMSGHSFGAMTTQAVSGQEVGRRGPIMTDKRIRAAVIMSPSSPKIGSPESAFGGVKLPWLLMTGTQDTSPIGEQTVESRLAVYPALSAGDKYQLVLNEAEHSAFTERALPGERATRNPNHHKAILALSTAFWDTYLKDDSNARTWLKGAGARSVLEDKDQWDMK